jgi:iron(III) transport system substrate-binding protein
MSFVRGTAGHVRAGAILLIALLALTACQAAPIAAPTGDTAADSEEASLLVYSGRNENLVGPLLEQYAAASGVDVQVRYGDTAEMAATILEEGQNSPADVFFGQDAGALGALAGAGRCTVLPEEIVSQVEPRFVSPDNEWIGVSGRARTLVYNTDMLSEEDLPASVFDLTDESWSGRVGWAPTNGSFQSFVTALRVNAGEDAARQWLEAMVANGAQVYPNNTSIVEAVGRGEVEVGLVNHYYLFRFLAEDPDFPAANYYFPAGDLGAMINVAGVCIINSSNNQDAGLDFVNFLLSPEAQQYFADETNEYPLAGGEIAVNPAIRPLAEIDTPDFNLGDLDDLQGTLLMLQEVGAVQ